MQNEGWNLEHSYKELPEVFYRNQNPEIAPAPQMIIFNHNLAESLGLDSSKLESRPEIFAGSALPHGAMPISQAYAGFQFGHFAMLGDGRAVLLGEQITPDGNRFDIQLKGSGPTHFSQNGDGYAALLPMLREYIISEAMYYLGIPTTRSLAVALTGKNVLRETVLKGAVLTRVASSHIRVGTFDYISSFGKMENTHNLADYCIWRHFPELEKAGHKDNKYIRFFRAVAKRQASLIAKWQLVGFIHGVMNTDNMAISGETIDYGPCAFMNSYDPDTVFSSIDKMGRYSYNNQPKIGAWNLSRLAEALLPLFHEEENKAIELANKEIEYYWECYNKNWLSGMRAKLGITNEETEDTSLITELLELMWAHKLDYTNTFRALSYPIPLSEIPDFSAWQTKWQSRLSRQPQSQNDVSDIMQKHNPAIIPRNHRVEEALAAAENEDFTIMHKLLAALSKPYEDCKIYSQPPEPTGCKYKTFCGT
ncbi:MAG: YdiU family protein [Defluviitaleaceae bacterium]|nr:YdiU family protein [Defluviitaleaceae bacterium]